MQPGLTWLAFVAATRCACGIALNDRLAAEPYGADSKVTFQRRFVDLGPDISPKLITNNFTTVDEFRLTFDIIPRKNATAWSSLVRLTNYSKNSSKDRTHNEGTAGDRMPFFIMEPGTTKIEAYMGAADPSDPNAGNVQCKCVGADCPFAPIGKKSEVMFRLIGDTCALYINRVMVCVQQRFERRYRSDGNVHVWIGDEYWPGAPVAIGNVEYAALQNPNPKHEAITALDPDHAVTTSEIRGADALLLNISMGLKMELDRIKEHIHVAQANMTLLEDIIAHQERTEKSYQPQIERLLRITALSKAKLGSMTDDLLAHEESLMNGQVRLHEEVEELRATLESLKPQIASLEDVLATIKQNAPILGPAAAQVSGMLKVMMDTVQERKAEVEKELPATIKTLTEVVETAQASLEITQKAYDKESIHYAHHSAELGKMQGSQLVTRRVHTYWVTAQTNVAIAQGHADRFLGWMPELQHHVDGNVNVGREITERILDTYKDDGKSTSRADMFANESGTITDGKTKVITGQEGPAKYWDKDKTKTDFLTLRSAHLHKDPVTRELPRTEEVYTHRGLVYKAVAPSGGASVRPSPTIGIKDKSRSTDFMKPLAALLRSATDASGQASLLAADLIERGSDRLGSTALRRLADRIRKAPNSEGVFLLRTLRGQLSKRDEEDKNNVTAKVAKKKCIQQQKVAMAERKQVRSQHHELLMRNATLQGDLMSCMARKDIMQSHMNSSVAFLETWPEVDMTRALKNETLRKYMMQDLDDIRIGLKRWTQWKAAHPAQIYGIDKTCDEIEDSIRQVQDEGRQDIDKIEADLKKMKEDMLAAAAFEDKAMKKLGLSALKVYEELDEVTTKLEKASDAIKDADKAVAKAEAACKIEEKMESQGDEKNSKREEEEQVVDAAVELLLGNDGQHGVI